jgi:hypothetical protein
MLFAKRLSERDSLFYFPKAKMMLVITLRSGIASAERDYFDRFYGLIASMNASRLLRKLRNLNDE